MQSRPESTSLLRRIRLGRGELWALGAALAYALYQVFLRVAVRGDELNTMVGATVQAIPVLLFSVAMGWIVKRRDRGTVSPLSDWRLIGALIVNGLLLFVVATPLLFAALREGGVLITSPLTGTQVIWSALLAALLLRERFTSTMALGMVVSVIGVAALTVGRSGGIQLSGTWWVAVPFALGTAFCWALAGVLLTYCMRRGVDRFQVLAIPTLLGVGVLNAYLLLTGDIGLYPSTPVDVLMSLLVAGTFSAAALVCLTTALALTTVASAATLNSLQVALAPLMAWLFLGEELKPLIGIGILLILVGVIVVQRAMEKTDDG
jgi:DME family drug/metabolite transporter